MSPSIEETGPYYKKYSPFPRIFLQICSSVSVETTGRFLGPFSILNRGISLLVVTNVFGASQHFSGAQFPMFCTIGCLPILLSFVILPCAWNHDSFLHMDDEALFPLFLRHLFSHSGTLYLVTGKHLLFLNENCVPPFHWHCFPPPYF